MVLAEIIGRHSSLPKRMAVQSALSGLFAALLVLAACGEVTAPTFEDPPNIVLILVDDLRWDALGVTGHPFSVTPNIDRLASEGILFENAFVVHSVCKPSRASMFTGQYSHNHGLLHNGMAWHPRDANVFEALKAAGYRVGYVGKWHLGSAVGIPPPWFDRWVSFSGQGEYRDPTLNIDGELIAHTGHMTDLLTTYSLDFLKKATPDTTPFVLVLSHKAVHAPFTPQERFEGTLAAAAIEPPPTFEEDLSLKPAWVATRAISEDVGQLRSLIQQYFETLRGVDESVGEVLAAIQERGLLDETLVILIGDNGFFLGEHRLIDKRAAYEESIRIPLIVRFPGWFTTPGRSQHIALNIDIAATLHDAAGVPGPGALAPESRSLRTVARQGVRSSFLYEYFEEPRHPVTPTLRAIRTLRYKYTTYLGAPDQTDELYDIRLDPVETNNLLESPDHQHVLESLRSELADLRARTGDL
jgi:N-acetylglucosamine-6-sulfatase